MCMYIYIYIIHVGKAFEDGTEPKTMPMKFNGIIYIYICVETERGRERERVTSENDSS